MNCRRTLILGICLASAFLVSAPSAAAVILIDDFSTGFSSADPLVTSGVVPTTDATGGSGIVGGSRESELHFFDIDASGTGSIAASIGATGALTISASSGDSGDYNVRYDGTVGSGGSGLNLDVSGTDLVRFDFSSITGTFDVFVGVKDGAGVEGTRTVTVSSAGIVDVLYSDFAFSGPGFDETDVDEINVDLQNALTNFGFTLDEVSLNAVPEPSNLAALGGLLGMALIGRWWRRRRGS